MLEDSRSTDHRDVDQQDIDQQAIDQQNVDQQNVDQQNVDQRGDAERVAPEPAVDTSGAVTRRGRYRLGERLGRGGASVVHRGWDQRLERPVAVKVFTMPGPAAADREARVAAGLDHPGVVPVYDVEELDGHDAVVMPLIEGPNLAARLADEGPLPVVEVLEVGAQLADGLAHVHGQGIVHRDVKPSNVLLGTRGARLTDFGIARIPGTTTITGDGLILGTAAYLAPEQIRAEEVGPAADVFALGLLLVECLTGVSCYPKDPGECAARLDRAPELPVGLGAPAEVERDLVRVLADLTSLDAASRPSAAAVATRLTRLHQVATRLATGSVAAEPATEPATDDADSTEPSGWAETVDRLAAAAPLSGWLLLVATAVAVLALLAGREDVAIPVVVAAMASQGAVLCFSLARRQHAARP